MEIHKWFYRSQQIPLSHSNTFCQVHHLVLLEGVVLFVSFTLLAQKCAVADYFDSVTLATVLFLFDFTGLLITTSSLFTITTGSSILLDPSNNYKSVPVPAN